MLSPGDWIGIAFGKKLRANMDGDTLVLHGCTREDFELIWKNYFGLNCDYGKMTEVFMCDPVMRRALEFAPGIRVLRQEPFETLCSFILSQNNNIKRIKGLVERLCDHFGEDSDGYRVFPTAEVLAGLSPEDLAPVRSGFRAKYIIDAAKRVHSGEISLELLYTEPVDKARETLMKIYGVGRKVADCTLLYGFARAECIPEDVWMKRALEQLYSGGLPEYLIPWGGIAQQTLFHYVRCCEGAVHKG